MISASFALGGVFIGGLIGLIGDYVRHLRATSREHREEILSTCTSFLADADELKRTHSEAIRRKINREIGALMSHVAVAKSSPSEDLLHDPWERAKRHAELDIQRLEINKPELVDTTKDLIQEMIVTGRNTADEVGIAHL